MIWTVVLKDGEHFVVHGSSYERNNEVRNALRARGFEDSVVAGIVQGNHKVDKYLTPKGKQDYSKQVKAALSAPTLAEAKKPRTYPAPSNDPRDW